MSDSDSTERFGREYEATLREYLGNHDESGLHRAYELGRTALAEGVSLFEVVSLHNRTLLAALPEAGVDAVRSGLSFLLEVLSPFEMAQRQFGEAVAALHHLNETLEEEIKRIAHALHDEAGQLLASIHLALEDVDRALPAPARDRVEDVRGLLRKVEDELRRVAHDLRPTILDDLGLEPALSVLAEGVARRTGMAVKVQGVFDRRLRPAAEIAFYRIAQEALNNAARHAKARHVTIELAASAAGASCTITDDGRGFDAAATGAEGASRGLGLIAMRERTSSLGGTLNIQSAPGRGTVLAATIPLRSDHADQGPPGRRPCDRPAGRPGSARA